MTQTLKLKVIDEPTMFNKEMAIGTLIFPVVGTLIGGWIGKNRMARELREGREVTDKPSFWTKDTLVGGLLGGLLVEVLSFALVGVAPIGEVIGALSWIGGTVAGAYIGGNTGKSRQTADFEQAKQQAIAEHLTRNAPPEVAQAVEYSMARNKNWAKDVTEQKLLAEAQQNVRQ